MVSQIGHLPKPDYDQVPEDRTLTINGILASTKSGKPTGPLQCFIGSGCNKHAVTRPDYFISQRKVHDLTLQMEMNFNGKFRLA
jgi:hypothetical protein